MEEKKKDTREITHPTAYFTGEHISSKDKLLEEFLREVEERALIHFLFEWDMLIRALQVYSVINFHLLSPGIKANIMKKNFSFELKALEDLITRLSILSVRLENRNSEFYTEFEGFLEEYFLRNYGVSGAENVKSEEEESYWEMISSATELFLDWRNILKTLKKNADIPYQTFFSSTRRIVRELKAIPFMDAFLQKKFKRPIDKVYLREISSTVVSISDRLERRRTAVIFLQISRLIKYLDHLEMMLSKKALTARYYPILILIRHEVGVLIRLLDLAGDSIPNLKELASSIIVQLENESKKVFGRLLLNITMLGLTEEVKHKVEKTIFILKNLLQDIAVKIIRHYSKRFDREKLFPSHVGRKIQTRLLLTNLDAAMARLELLLSKPRVERYDLEEFIKFLKDQIMPYLLYKDWEIMEKYFSDMRRAKGQIELNERLANMKNYLLYLKDEVAKRKFEDEVSIPPSQEKGHEAAQ